MTRVSPTAFPLNHAAFFPFALPDPELKNALAGGGPLLLPPQFTEREIEAQGGLETEPWSQQGSHSASFCSAWTLLSLGAACVWGDLWRCTWGSSRAGSAYSKPPLLSTVPNTLSTPAGSELPVCASCGQRIYDGQYLQALNADWHADCFR